MAGSQIIAWNVQMAGSFLAALPTLLVYIFLGRYFLRGLLAGSEGIDQFTARSPRTQRSIDIDRAVAVRAR
jgi:hypothetical protein